MRILPAFGLGLLGFSAFCAPAMAGSGQALQIIVSKELQQVTVYDGLEVVAQSNVSTGKPGHTTPSGIFSILEKRKFHRSNLYDDAPMPWMQRITWSGVALHESNHVPPRPASHGCVRLPAAFAKDLYQLTERGAHVVISDEPVAPQLLAGDVLPKPRLFEPAPTLSDVPLRASIGSTDGESIEVAMNDPQPGIVEKSVAEEDRSPIYIMITRTSEQHRVAQIQQRLNDLGFQAGTVDGVLGKMTRRAIEDFRAQYRLPPGAGMDERFLDVLEARDGKGEIANGMLMIRRDFKQIYSAGVKIELPEKALGTHFMEARDVSSVNGEVKWYGVSLKNHLSDKEAERLGITVPADDFAFNLPTKALARVHIPDEAREKMATLLTEGSAITITDTGYQRETGLGTNFVTLTRQPPKT